MKQWGLALSGGGACGLANIGVIEVLEEHNLKPNAISGSSMGAIIGAMYALGSSANALRKLAEDLQLTQMASFTTNMWQQGLHGGLLRPKLQQILGDSIGDATIADCATPFVCIAGKVLKPIQWHTSLSNGFTGHILECIEPHVFSKNTKILDAIMASSAVPVIFSPVEIDGEQFIDLVRFGAIPARTLQSLYAPEVLIATDTAPTYEGAQSLMPLSWRTFLEEGMDELQKSKAVCDLVIEPQSIGSPVRFDKADAWISSGREAAQNMLPTIQNILA